MCYGVGGGKSLFLNFLAVVGAHEMHAHVHAYKHAHEHVHAYKHAHEHVHAYKHAHEHVQQGFIFIHQFAYTPFHAFDIKLTTLCDK